MSKEAPFKAESLLYRTRGYLATRDKEELPRPEIQEPQVLTQNQDSHMRMCSMEQAFEEKHTLSWCPAPPPQAAYNEHSQTGWLFLH